METKGINHPAEANSFNNVTDRKDSHYSLFDNIYNLDVLYRAYLSARKGKRTKASVLKFEVNLTENLQKLSDQICNSEYRPLPPRKFSIKCGSKIREIAAPSFRDSVVQHAIYSEIYNLFDRGFIHDSYGCRRGKGNRRASDQLQRFVRCHSEDSYFLQIDMKKFYYSINHSILEESIRRKNKDGRLVDLIMLFCSEPSGVGLNIGCLLSQIKGLIYLDRFDHFVKRVLKIKHYIRYVDDCVFVGLSKDQAIQILEITKNYLKDNLHLSLSKWRVGRLKEGINFVGYRTWIHGRLIRKHSLKNYRKAIRNNNANAIRSLLNHAINTMTFGKMLNSSRRQTKGHSHDLQISKNRNERSIRHHCYPYYI